MQGRIAAVHVNHGLQNAAGAWDDHCRTVCTGLGVHYVSLQVDGRAAAGESREAAARAARYAVLKAWLPQGDCLMTAQHRDDQAETLLLQLLRGSGVKGLAAMPRLAPFGGGYLMRPLLDCSRDALLDYAGTNQLNWVDDPSNRDISLDRTSSATRCCRCCAALACPFGNAVAQLTPLRRGGDDAGGSGQAGSREAHR